MTNSYQGNLRTKASHLKSGKDIITDAPEDNSGRGEAFSPTDLVATALSTCMITVMAIHAEKNSIDITGMHSEVTKLMAADPRRVSEISINIHWPGCDASETQREKLRHIALTCPVAQSLHPDLKQNIVFDF